MSSIPSRLRQIIKSYLEDGPADSDDVGFNSTTLDDFRLEQNQNGHLTFVHEPSGTTYTLQQDGVASLPGDIEDSGNNTTVYDQSAQQLGSGNEDGDFASVATAGDVTDDPNNNTIYDQANQEVTADVNNQSVNTEDVDIGEKDYIKTGQFDPRFSLSPHATRQLSDASASYTSDPNWIYHRVTWDTELPQANSAVYVTWDAAVAGTNETLDVRLFNDADGETIVEKTGADGSTSMGPVTYTPPTTASAIGIQLEVRSSPGTNSSTVYNPNVVFGVQL